GLTRTHATTATLAGRVIDAVSSNSVESADVIFDLVPVDGIPEAIFQTDPFGFFVANSITAGTYEVIVDRPGYFTQIHTTLFAVAETVNTQIMLAPAFGPEGAGFDILAQVQCVTTAEKLDGVPVGVSRFTSPLDALPAFSTSAVTDAEGFVRLRGMRRGYYRFRANDVTDGAPRPKWDPFSTETDTNSMDKVLVEATQLASFLLKPEPLQDLIVDVAGFDPVFEAPGGPIAGANVVLTGRSLHPDMDELVPPRTGVTDSNGMVRFSRLPAIAWTIETRKLGYAPGGLTIFPDGAGDLPAPVLVPVTINPTVLEVVLTSPYDEPMMMDGVDVELTGLADSNTEDIKRLVPAMVETGIVKSVFMGLLPGKYEVNVRTAKMSPPIFSMDWSVDPFHVNFHAQDYVTVADGVTTSHPLNLEVVPTRVRVRLYAADAIGEVSRSISGDALDRPIYQLREQTGIVFCEAAHTGGLLNTNDAEVIIDTAASGEVTFNILPGVYGIKIPGMSNYWGSEILYDLAGGPSVIDMGWPYGDFWPYGPTRREAHHAAGVAFDSGGDVRLDLFVRKHQVKVVGDVAADAKDPTTYQILANPSEPSEVTVFHSDIALNGGTVTLSTSGVMIASTNLTPLGNIARSQYVFPEVKPGVYTLTATHPRNTFTPVGFTVGPWGFPGDLPPTLPLSPADFVPLTTLISPEVPLGPEPIPLLEAVFTSPDTVTLDVYAYDMDMMVYNLQFTTRPQIAEAVTYASGVHCSLIAPDFHVPKGMYRIWTDFGANGWHLESGTGSGSFDVYLDGPMDNTSSSNAPSIKYNLTARNPNIDDSTMLVTGSTNVLDGGMKVAHGATLMDYEGSFTPTNVINPMWEWPGAMSFSYKVLDHSIPHIELTVPLRLGLGVTGMVRIAGTTTGVASSMSVFDRYGDCLRFAKSGTNGAFQIASALPAGQTLFVDVNAFGFKPWRQRYGAAAILAAGSNLVIDAELEPIPEPTFVAADVDRRGLFIPGARLSGSESAWNGLSADEILKMTWTAKVATVVCTNVLPAFDNPDGTAGPMVTSVVRDAISDIWIIDPRTFATSIYSDPPMPAMPPPGAPADPALGTWLTTAGNGGLPNLFFQRVRNPAGAADPMVCATGTVQLSQLPPGEFTPIFVAVTARGVIGVKRDYAFPGAVEQLRGLRMPPWIAQGLNLMAVAAATQKTADDLKDILPTGRFKMLPTFTGSIALTNTKFVVYD
ncbi:MAG: carboxypeptidase-like regulatory domain-containing protein, partial [Verrucomicrobiota bacterium]